MIFMTKSGSLYVVNEERKTIRGGIFQNATAYTKCCAIIGERGCIELADGRVCNTSVVERYLGVGSL